MLLDGMTIEEIASERNLAVTTIESHIAHLVGQGIYNAKDFVSERKREEIKEYFECTGDRSLMAAKDVLGNDYSFGEIRIMLAQLDREHFFENLPNDEVF